MGGEGRCGSGDEEEEIPSSAHKLSQIIFVCNIFTKCFRLQHIHKLFSSATYSQIIFVCNIFTNYFRLQHIYQLFVNIFTYHFRLQHIHKIFVCNIFMNYFRLQHIHKTFSSATYSQNILVCNIFTNYMSTFTKKIGQTWTKYFSILIWPYLIFV